MKKMDHYENNLQMTDYAIKYGLEIEKPISEGEILNCILHHPDPTKELAEMFAEKMEEERRSQMLYWLLIVFAVFVVMGVMLFSVHKEKEKFKQQLYKTVGDEVGF